MGDPLKGAKAEESKNYEDRYEDRGKVSSDPEARLSKQIATNDDATANQEEVEEQIEGDNVEEAARENETSGPAPIMKRD